MDSSFALVRTHQHGKASTVSTPIRCVILHFRDRRGAALLLYM